ERDEGLAWYRSCRIYHLTPGADCGWRSGGTGKIPTYAYDAVKPTAEIHRGSPTGVVSYRHRVFPKRYRGGLFAADWTMGRIYYVETKRDGATYRDDAEVFVQAARNISFAPTDLAVSPDGSLLVSSGGRGVAGAVYRLRYRPKNEKDPHQAALTPKSAIDVARYPQPLAEWSRKIWKSRASELTWKPFRNIAINRSTPRADRVRAIEILAEMFPNELPPVLDRIASDRDPALRLQHARRIDSATPVAQTVRAIADKDLHVKRAAAERAMWYAHLDLNTCRALATALLEAANTNDRRLRQAISASLVHFDPQHVPEAKTIGARITRAYASTDRTAFGSFATSSIEAAIDLLGQELSVDDTLDALRLLDQSFDRGKRNRDPRYKTFDTTWDRVDLKGIALVEPARATARKLLDSKHEVVRREALNVLGRLRDPLSETADRVASWLTESSPIASDVEVFRQLAKFDAKWSAETLRRVTDTAFAFPEKLRKQGVGRDNRWHSYLAAIWNRFHEKQPSLAKALVEDERFGDAEHLDTLSGASKDVQRRAAKRFLSKPAPEDVSGKRKLLDFLSKHLDKSDDERFAKHLVEAFESPTLQSLALRGLASRAKPDHRELFYEALELDRPELVETALKGLERLEAPGDIDGELAMWIRWGLQLDRDPTRRSTRDRIARRIQNLTTWNVEYDAKRKGSQRAAFAAWAKKLGAKNATFKEEMEDLLAEAPEVDQVRTLLATAPWSDAEPERGRKVFERLACTNCHQLEGRGRSVGPDLKGVGRRLKREQILTELLLPNRVVAKRYWYWEYTLKNGDVVQGRQVYNSRAALLLVTRDGGNRRIEAKDIVSQVERPYSLMPTGLLQGLKPREVADLVRFLESR
ncbi:MAG: c-type cytochrome, partial [Planctomycetota bacterium]